MGIDREKRFLYNSKGVDTKLQIGYPSKKSGNDGEERVVKTPDGNYMVAVWQVNQTIIS